MNNRRYRVSVRSKNGPLKGRYVVQAVNLSYDTASEIYYFLSKKGFEVIIVRMNVLHPNLKKTWLYRPKGNKNELSNNTK